MPPSDSSFVGEVRYARELGLRQAASLGLRASLPLLAFLVLEPLTQVAGIGAPLALVLGIVVWTPTVLSYLELSSASYEGGVYESIAQYRTGLLPFLATWVLLLADLLAAGLLVHEAANLIRPWQMLAPSFDALTGATALARDLALPGLDVLMLGAVLFIALLRRRPWLRIDELTLLGGLAAVLLVAVSAFLAPAQPGALIELTFRGAMTGALLPVLILLSVEAINEWKAELRQPERMLPRVTLVALTILTIGTLILLLAGLRRNGALLAAQGLAPLLRDLPLRYASQIASLLFVATIITAASSLLLQANRLLRQLWREGYLPAIVPPDRRVGAAAGMVLVSLLSGGALLLPKEGAFSAVVGMAVLLAIAINVTTILSRPSQDDSRTAGLFLLPFPPLTPALGLAITLFLLLTVSQEVIVSMLSALALGGLIYALYGRKAHRAAQEARTVFRKKPKDATPTADERFRVLVPLLGNPAEQRALIRAATALAAQENGEVLALQVVTLPPQRTRAEGARLARERNQILQWSMGQSKSDAPVTPLTRIGRDLTRAIADTAREEHCDLILLTWRSMEMEGVTTFSYSNIAWRTRLVSDLVRGTSCMVAAVDGELTDEVKRILVPTAGGPNAPLAARFALGLAGVWGAEVIGLNIVRDEEDGNAMALARERVLSTFAGLPGGENVEVRLVHSQAPVVEALVEEANQGYDLVMMGASNEGLLDRVLFGDIPQRVAEQTATPAIMVRAARPPQEAWLRLTWDRLQDMLPTLEADEQIDLYRSLRRGARPNVNFFVLIVLSALIATLGLWQNSAAVIIGAMLVAPLMTPILATSLGIVLGEARMIRVSIEATVKGVAAGIAIALFFTLLLPQQQGGSEILARTRPTILDLVVALASGAAGAYAVARKEVSAALPGVAIAAALMPPLCTVGIGLASFSGLVAGGAMLLFTTNLIAINVASGLVFLLLGMRPRRGEQAREAQFRRGLTVAIVMLLIISVPLTWLGLRNIEQTRSQRAVNDWLTAAVSATGDAQLLQLEVQSQDSQLEVYARVQTATGDVQTETVQAWSELLARRTGRPIHLKVDVQPVSQWEARSP